MKVRKTGQRTALCKRGAHEVRYKPLNGEHAKLLSLILELQRKSMDEFFQQPHQLIERVREVQRQNMFAESGVRVCV